MQFVSSSKENQKSNAQVQRSTRFMVEQVQQNLWVNMEQDATEPLTWRNVK